MNDMLPPDNTRLKLLPPNLFILDGTIKLPLSRTVIDPRGIEDTVSNLTVPVATVKEPVSMLAPDNTKVPPPLIVRLEVPTILEGIVTVFSFLISKTVLPVRSILLNGLKVIDAEDANVEFCKLKR